jgi:hypothetical protein
MTLAINTRQEVVIFAFPKPSDWKDIVRDLKLTTTQERELEITIRHVLAEIESYHVVKNKIPPREQLVAALKRLEKALGRLQCELNGSTNLLEHFLPHDTKEYIGQSLTFSAIGDALGADVFPESFDFQLERMLSDEGQITVASFEELSQPTRQALGLKYGHVILAHFIAQVYAPLKKWIALDKLNKGGRPAENIFRGFYSCGGHHQKGKSVCRGRHIPMIKLDDLIVDNVKQRLFTSERLSRILESLIERQSDKDRAVQDRRAALKAELVAKEINCSDFIVH